MTAPQPEQDTINEFIEALKNLGGKSGNKKLQTKLNMNDTTYTWIRDYLINEGQIKPGRGRGGSVKLLNEEEAQQAKQEIQEKQYKEQIKTHETEEENFNLEQIKNKYKEIPEDLNEFTPGMHVVRPMLNTLTEHNAWRHMKHYTVTKTQEGFVFVKPLPTRKNQVELASPPTGFYKPQ